MNASRNPSQANDIGAEAAIDAPAGYGRARLWLGISAVGTIVVLSVASLAIDLPGRLANAFGPSLAGSLILLGVFLLTYAIVQVPFDLFGGYLLPRRFGRAHPPLGRFGVRLLRGFSMHTLVLMGVGVALLLGGRLFGAPGVIAMGVVLSVLLLIVRMPLARAVAPLGVRRGPGASDTVSNEGLRVEVIESEDEGFTGGFTGVLRPRRMLIPARWVDELGEQGISMIKTRRGLAIRTGAWLRGRILALAFTWVGIASAALGVGSERLGTGEGIMTLSLWFTLWSFLGLLTLPTPSRAGVTEVDAALRASGVDRAALDDTLRRLDQLQDNEPHRPAGVEAIFHPVPGIRNRIEGSTTPHRRGCLDAARTAVFLSASGLGLLGRAVHCNCGRPAVWVYLPSD